MVYPIILFAVILIGLVIATITDLKTREVPDWLSYGMIAVGLGLSLLFSVIYRDYWFFVNSIVGFLLFLIVALIMFYAGQWGGGDSKVLMGLGALIGFDARFIKFPFMIGFLVNILLVGAIYGLIWSLVLMIRNLRKFLKEFKRISHNAIMMKLKTSLVVFAFLMLVLFFLNKDEMMGYLFLALLLMVLSTFYLWMFVKAIERTCMIKAVTPDKLTEGDWIVKDIKYRGRYICGPKDLGIEKRQIGELVKLHNQGKIKKVMIKEGIPFVPSFLIAYAVSLFFGNFLFFII